VIRQSRRTFAERLDFVTTVGFGAGVASRQELGLTGGGPKLVITDLGVLRPAPGSGELVLAGIYPGVSVEHVKDSTGWDLAVSPDLSELGRPSAADLTALRELLAGEPAAAPVPIAGGTTR